MRPLLLNLRSALLLMLALITCSAINASTTASIPATKGMITVDKTLGKMKQNRSLMPEITNYNAHNKGKTQSNKLSKPARIDPDKNLIRKSSHQPSLNWWANYNEFINGKYVDMRYLYSFDNRNLVPQDPFYEGGYGVFFKEYNGDLWCGGLYWFENYSYYIPIIFNNVYDELGEVISFAWGTQIENDTLSAGGSERVDTVRNIMLVSQDYYLDGNKTDIRGHIWSDGSIVFDDNYVVCGYYIYLNYKNNQLVSRDSIHIEKVYVNTHFLKANAEHKFQYKGKNSSPTDYNANLYLYQPNDSVWAFNLFSYGLPNVILLNGNGPMSLPKQIVCDGSVEDYYNGDFTLTENHNFLTDGGGNIVGFNGFGNTGTLVSSDKITWDATVFSTTDGQPAFYPFYNNEIHLFDGYQFNPPICTINGITYSIDGEDATIISFNTYETDLVIPETINYNGKVYSVSTIGQYAFEYNPLIESVTIPKSIKVIQGYAFNGDTNLKRLYFEKGSDILEIGHYDASYYIKYRGDVFKDCPIEEIYLGRDCQYKGYSYSSPFQEIETLTTVDIDNTTINSLSFRNCKNLESIEIRNSVLTIGSSAFSGCERLSSLSIPNSVISIGAGAFNNCSNVLSIFIPNSVQSIGDYAFQGCSSLRDFVIEDGNNQLKFNASSGYVGSVSCNCISPSIEYLYIGRDVTDDSYFSYASTNYGYQDASPFHSFTELFCLEIGSNVTNFSRFRDCPILNMVICHPLTPPNTVFNNMPQDIDVFVHPTAVEDYLNSSVWKNYNIIPITSNIRHLTVNLPVNVNVADYSHLRLELDNGGKTSHFIITDKSSYTFNSIEQNSVCNVSLQNLYGDVFGKIENIQVGEDDMDVTFASLTKPQNTNIIVKIPDGNDVTSQCKISWFDENGELLLQGDTIKQLPAGRKLAYSVKLSQELAIAYSLPATMTYTVKEGSNNVLCQLTSLTQTQLSGKVKEASTNQPINGASISATQTFAGGETKTLTTRTDTQGQYFLDASSVPTTLTVAAPGYISQTIGCDMASGSTVTVPDVALSLITGALVNINLTYTPAHAEDEAPEVQNWYSDHQNVDYEVYNRTLGRAITDISVQYPQIVLMEDVNDGDLLEITATSRKDAFTPVKTIVTIVEQRATATINIVERGKIAAKFKKNTNPAVVGTLYDAEGMLVTTSNYSGDNLTLSDLSDGDYKLITMGKSDFFNEIYDLGQFADVGLQNGVDYALNAITITDGIITPVTINEVPFFDETKFYYMGENTSFTVNKPSVVVGNYLTFRARIDFKDEFKDKINDVQIIVDLPSSCSFYENSVMIGASMGDYSASGNRIMIPIANYDELVRFCVIPTKAGDFAPSAFVQFQLNGKTITQPIGNANYHVENISSLIVPPATASTTISIGGTALTNCQIDIYDNDVLIGHATANANSKWLTKCELHQPYNLSSHSIYAIITTDAGIEVPTEAAICIYDKNVPQVSKVTQYNEQRGPTPYLVTWNFLNPSLSSQHYSYDMYDNHRTFSYTIEFTDNKAVSNVTLYVKTAKSGWWLLDATYDEEKDVWVTAGEFGDSQNADLPVNVGVDFKCTIDTISVENLVYALAISLNHESNDVPDVPEINEDDYTVTQNQGNTVFDFDELQIDGSIINSIIVGESVSMQCSSGGINKNYTFSYGGVNSLPQDAYEYKLNDSQSLFVTDTSDYYTAEVCYYFPVSVINTILNTPYAQQSHRFDFFNNILEKAGSTKYVFVKQYLMQDKAFPSILKDPLDDVLENCPDLEPMVREMRWRQEHSARLNERLDRFRDFGEWVSRVLNRIGGLGEVAGAGIDAGCQAVEVGQNIGNYQNSLHDENYWAQFEAVGCVPRNRPPRPTHQYPGADITFCIDPSGFVYEGVPSNRLQGVTATCYYKETVEDMYGDEHEEVVLWDAEQYGQENPLLTDENGYYRWDVPIGMWQVKYEKAGYETTYSDWLPVPPPQLDVNIGMVQMRQPEVIKAHAYPKAVELEFDKFMIPETLTTDNISVKVNGSDVSGTIELLNAEKDDPLAITSIRRAPGTGLTFASRVRFNADQPFNAEQVTLRVKQDVKSYADLMMNEDYEAVLPIELEMQEIAADSVVIVPYHESKQLTVIVLPAAASAGKVINVASTSMMIATTDAEQYTLDNNGKAVITVHGDLPGMTSLVYGIHGYDLKATTLINVLSENQMTVAAPTASIASGSEVEKGMAVYLRCATKGATIYYTLDGSCPCDPSPARKVYDGTPIIINSDVTIKAMATAPDLYDSDVATFVYRVSGGIKGDVNNDGEVNIADINAVIDIILGGNADADTRERADVNGDGEINIADINAVINIILDPSRLMSHKVNCDDILHLENVSIKPGEIRTLQVNIDNASQYSAMQCDIVLPEGLTLVSTAATGGNVSKIGHLDEMSSRALSYSATKTPFMDNGQGVMSITVLSDATLASESEIKLTNVVLADDENKAWYLSDCKAQVNNTSGINDLTAISNRVWTEDAYLCIESQQNDIARITTISGIVYEVTVNTGITRYELAPSIYVVTINGNSYKIAIK